MDETKYDHATECDDAGIDHLWNSYREPFCSRCGIGQWRALNMYQRLWRTGAKENTRLKSDLALAVEALEKIEDLGVDATIIDAWDLVHSALKKLKGEKDG